jgi:hypothetical protein
VHPRYQLNQLLVLRETSKEQTVQARRNEGVAIHIRAPEPCAGVCEPDIRDIRPSSADRPLALDCKHSFMFPPLNL